MLKEIYETAKVEAPGKFPSSVVLEQITDLMGNDAQFNCYWATHVKVYPANNEPFKIWGHYEMDEEAARKDVETRFQSLHPKAGTSHNFIGLPNARCMDCGQSYSHVGHVGR